MPIQLIRKFCSRLKNDTKLSRKRPVHRLRIGLKYTFRKSHKEPVFVLTARRTGSNLLLAYLNSVPGLFFAPEVLNEKMKYGLSGRGISKRAVLDHIRHSINDCPTMTCGTKLLAFQMEKYGLETDDLIDAFPNARFLVLYRKSLVEQFVSLKIAETTDQWLWSKDFRFPESIVVSKDELNAFRAKMLRFYGKLCGDRRLAGRSLFLSYEELAADPQRLFDEKIFPFLGASPCTVVTDTKKQNTRPLELLIDNYPEIEPLLRELETDFSGVERKDFEWSRAAG